MMKAAMGKSMAAFVIVEKKNIICYNSRKDATLMIRGSLTGDSKKSLSPVKKGQHWMLKQHVKWDDLWDHGFFVLHLVIQ